MTEALRVHDKTGIAIVGMAGRFPGAPSIKEFWRNLTEGVESVQFASNEELTASGVDPTLIANPDYVPASSTVREPEFFDASFFGFSVREAEIIDPQQRVFLECAWEALEDAACDPGAYPGAIGVFAGTGMNLYGVVNLFSNPEVIASVGAYQVMVGNDKDFLCSRASYKLNLRGPAVGVQTACSTSLVAVQMAFESLLRNECDVALAGGVSISLPQPVGYLYIPGMILSRDGHCRAFDASASGTVPGAGAGIIVLKRLEDAVADGDHIYAVLRGAAINNDGSAKVGYSAPGVKGQSDAIRRSMKMADFAPESVSYVETHGTGTEVGDPIEIAALSEAFQTAAIHPHSCALGALKTNIGHLDAAAGVAGLIKTALCVKHKTIPPTLHFTKANPLIDFGKTPFYVNTKLTRYEKPEPFRAGVSSFGIGGTNAHVSLEEAPQNASDPTTASQLIVLSAKTASALEKQSAQFSAFLEENPSTNLTDLAFTLQKGRQAFRHRRVIVASDASQLRASLQAGLPSAGQQQLRTDDAPTDAGGVAFLFPGQGSQYINMGLELYRTAPVFRDMIDRCCDMLQPHLGFDLRSILYPVPGEEAEAERRLNQTEITQPALFVIEYAMASLWMDCGILPSAMIGHSVGEYVAACIAQVFSLEDALSLIAARGKMIQAAPAGAMLAVSLSEQDLEPLISADLSVAAINSPRQAVASGPEVAIAALESTLKNKKIECRRLRTSHAFHSPMMENVAADFIQRVAKIKLHPPKIRYLSNVSGTWITDKQATSPEYWGSHLRNTVRFSDCGRNLLREPINALLEVGPGDTLLSLLRSQLEPRNKQSSIPSMRHPLAKDNDRSVWLTAAGRLWLLNAHLNWDGLYRGERRVRLSLPTYPFERQRYWIEPKKAQAVPQATLEKRPNIADWFYVPSWKRSVVELLKKSEIVETDTWLLLAEDGGFADKLTKELQGHGKTVRVRTAAKFQRVSSELYELNPANREDYVSLVRDLQAEGRWPRRIVHAWMLDSSNEKDGKSALDRGVFTAMFLIQAMEDVNPGRPTELNVVGDRAHSILGEQVSSPAISALIAFCKVIAVEHANVTCRAIDIDFKADFSRGLQQLVGELISAASNEVVGYRGSARWTQHYEPVWLGLPADADTAPQRSNTAISLKTGGTYLITGGMGGIGLVLAQHLAHRAKARVVLTSRSRFPVEEEWEDLLKSPDTPGPVKRKIDGLRGIKASGGNVTVLEADSTDLSAMQQILAAVRAEYGPIRGIIHSAGVAGAGLMQAKSYPQASAVLTPKVQGTDWIRECLSDKDLDFVMLCSSINAVMPSVGLSDYAAANAYLDGFAAAFDDPKGTRVLSVNWDTWREVGMVADASFPPELEYIREEWLKHAILTTEARDAFDRILNSPLPHILISTRNFDLLQQQAWKGIANLQETMATSVNGATDSMQHRPASLENFAAAEGEVEGYIVNVWQELLGIKPIGIHDDFFKLGGHSLLGTQVLARLRERFKVDMSLRTIFEASTPAELAQYIRVLSWASTSEAPTVIQEREEIEI